MYLRTSDVLTTPSWSARSSCSPTPERSFIHPAWADDDSPSSQNLSLGITLSITNRNLHNQDHLLEVFGVSGTRPPKMSNIYLILVLVVTAAKSGRAGQVPSGDGPHAAAARLIGVSVPGRAERGLAEP